LSIIDLSPAGHQPLSNKAKTVWITFNGEIYNFQELRSRLIKKGYKFHTKTDTEVIIHLWEEHGVECLSMLRGMFAFALWDDKQKTLLLARDRLGKKPLKYYQDKNSLIFASELKAILTQKINTSLDHQAIDDFLSLEAVPAPRTGFTSIKKLPAASYLLVKNNQIKIKKYWQLKYYPKLKLNQEELTREIIARLTEAIRLRLIADVPIGIFLSGGIDSSLILALMRSLKHQNINSYSVGFAGNKSELAFAKLVAKKFHTNHHQVRLTPNSWRLLPKLAQTYEDPYGDPSALPTFLVSRLAGQKNKVVLGGDGGDENFAGYQRYQKMALPISLVDQIGLGKPEWLIKAYAAAVIFTRHSESYRRQLYRSDFLTAVNLKASQTLLKTHHRQAKSALDKILLIDINTYLEPVLLPKVDLAGMAHGLEVRSPFLDHQLVEFCARIDSRLKLNLFTSKYILKKAAADFLPREIINRPKQGFTFPLGEWLEGKWRLPVKNLILDPQAKLNRFFNLKAVKNLLDQPIGSEQHQRKIWRLVMLEYWLQHYFPKL
jgi:asparagine synthase (glutamine-hydrolysing)